MTYSRVIFFLFVIAVMFAVPAFAAEPSPTTPNTPPAPTGSFIRQAMEDEISILLPLGTKEIHKVQQRALETEKAMSGPAPELINSSIPLGLDPGAEPPIIVLSPGYATSVVVFDRAGEPWPILEHIVGNPSSFTVMVMEAGGSNVLTIVPKRQAGHGSLTFTLEDHPSPITVRLVIDAGRKAYGTLNLVADRRGPVSAAKTEEYAGDTRISVGGPTDSVLLSFLDGVGVEGSREVPTDADSSVVLYAYEGRYYLRTPYPVLWPGWRRIVPGGGIFVYDMPQVPSIILSKQGRKTTITVK